MWVAFFCEKNTCFRYVLNGKHYTTKLGHGSLALSSNVFLKKSKAVLPRKAKVFFSTRTMSIFLGKSHHQDPSKRHSECQCAFHSKICKEKQLLGTLQPSLGSQHPGSYVKPSGRLLSMQAIQGSKFVACRTESSKPIPNFV